MPEGDTVWRNARLLDRELAGQVLTGSDFRVPALATVDLSGAVVVGTTTHGKHLLTHIDSPATADGHTRWTLHTHLKMEGAWQAYGPGQRWRRPAHTARVLLSSGVRTVVGFSLGIVDLVPRETEHQLVEHLGPDLLAACVDLAEASRRLVEDPTTPVVEAVQDQRRFAGIGNMYANELCFILGLHPATPVGDVRDPGRLVSRARSLLEQNKQRAQQSTTGDLRTGRRTWVYRQRSCRRCGNSVATVMTGPEGSERATYWCPHCQPEG